MDSLNQASDAQSASKGAPQDASREACAAPEDRILTGESPSVEGIVAEATLEVVAAPSF